MTDYTHSFAKYRQWQLFDSAHEDAGVWTLNPGWTLSNGVLTCSSGGNFSQAFVANFAHQSLTWEFILTCDSITNGDFTLASLGVSTPIVVGENRLSVNIDGFEDLLPGVVTTQIAIQSGVVPNDAVFSSLVAVNLDARRCRPRVIGL